MDVMHDVYPIVSKYFLQKRGLNISTYTRRKVGDFTQAVSSKVELLLNSYSKLQNELEIKVTL
jgi:4-hydroxy-tetrahydrodipicolinate synthase